MFAPATYARRRASLRAALAARGLDRGLVLVPGNPESPMNYEDNAYPFRQDSTFLYLFGHALPGLCGSLDLGSGEAILYAAETGVETAIWTGPLPSPGELAAACAATARDPARLEGELSARRAAGGAAAAVLYVRPYRAETRLELAALLDRAPRAVDEGASTPLMAALRDLREIKEPEELAELELAADISASMHRAVIARARPGMTEAELAAIATERALAGGGGLSFPVIATTRGSVLHNHDHSGVLREGGLFLLDCGAETARGYAGDLTSTFPIGKRFDGRQRAVYEIVLAGFAAATALLRPGLAFKEAHFAAARAMTEGLKGLGLLRGDTEEILGAGAHALFFPHGLGHLMGLDVHDMENYGEALVGWDGEPKPSQFGLRSLRLGKPLKPGMVHSVEPGLYFIEGLVAKWEAEGLHRDFVDYAEARKWLGFGGVRNEEDWLVTETGARKLGSPFDKSPDAIETLRA